MRSLSLVTALVGVLLIGAACSGGGSQPGAGDSPDAATGDPDAGSGAGSGGDAGVLAACVGKTTQPVDATWSVGGRNVRVHVPAGYDPARRTPIVVNLHGYSYDGASQAVLSHMIATSNAAGFIALHPDGHHTPRGWNAGVCCGAAATSGTDDVAWIERVLDEAEQRLCVDPARIYATGLSNGAFLAHRLGCESDRFAAIAPVAGVVGTPACNPPHPVAVFHTHGTSDPIIPFGGGGINGNEAVSTTIDRWVARNHCTGAPTTTFQHGDATCVTHGSCAGGADVTLCTIAGGGHQWPGGDSIGALSGTKSDDLIATEAMWTFFAAHPKAAATP